MIGDPDLPEDPDWNYVPPAIREAAEASNGREVLVADPEHGVYVGKLWVSPRHLGRRSPAGSQE